MAVRAILVGCIIDNRSVYSWKYNWPISLLSLIKTAYLSWRNSASYMYESCITLLHWFLRNVEEILQSTFSKVILWNDSLITPLVLGEFTQNVIGDKSTSFQGMAYFCQAISLSECKPRSISPYGVIRPQCVKETVHTPEQKCCELGEIVITGCQGGGIMTIFCCHFEAIFVTYRPKLGYHSALLSPRTLLLTWFNLNPSMDKLVHSL